MLQEFNTHWLITLNNLADSDQKAQFFGLVADGPIFFLPLFLVFMWLYYVTKNNIEQKKGLLFIFYATLTAVFTNIIIQKFVHFDRPESALQGSDNLIMEHIPDASFPSDHTAVSIAFVTALYFAGYRKTSLIFLPFALSMNTSRIIVGVHWPLDVIAGTVIGILSAIFVFQYFKNTKFSEVITKNILKIAKIIKL